MYISLKGYRVCNRVNVGLIETTESVKNGEIAPYATFFTCLWGCADECEEGVWCDWRGSTEDI